MAKPKAKPPPLPSLTTEFFERAQKGKAGAMDDLFERIHARLLVFCLYLTGNREHAKDLCQDAYVKVMEHIQSLDDPRYFMPWLYRITKNHFLDYVRSPKSKK